LSASGDLPPFPWLYPYQEDGPRLERIVHRPIVDAALAGPGGEVSPVVFALVDSGCSHVLAAPWLAQAVGVDPKESQREISLGLGGETVKVRFADLSIRLIAPGQPDDQFWEWSGEVGFIHHWKPTFQMIVGQHGFFDEFTVTMSSLAQVTAVEQRDEFDSRFGVPLAPPDDDKPGRRRLFRS